MSTTEPNGRLEEALRNLRDDLKDILQVVEKNEVRLRKLEEENIRYKVLLDEILIPLREPIKEITSDHLATKKGISWIYQIIIVVLTILGTLAALKMAGLL